VTCGPRASATTVPSVSESGSELIDVFSDVADEIAAALVAHTHRGPSGLRPDQYSFDVVTDEVAVPMLTAAGLGVLSEESGLHHGDRDIIVALDPVDGSTNASHGIPWFATSIAAVDGDGLVAALVANLATGQRFSAVRGEGAMLDGETITSSTVTDIGDAIIAVNGLPSEHLGWRQYRSLGACALDLCAVACGSLDGLLDATPGELAPWDYLGGLLICREAGAAVADGDGNELIVLDHDARRALVAAGTDELFDELLAGRDRLDSSNA